MGGDKYPERDTLAFIVLSKKRRKLLPLLLQGPRTLGDIREALNVSSSGIIPQLRKLEDRHLICRRGRKYLLTPMGCIIARHLKILQDTVDLFDTHSKYWREHDIRGIPEKFRMRLHELGKYSILENHAAIFKPYTAYIKNLEKSRWVKSVFPVLHPECLDTLLGMANRGKRVSIITTGDVVDEMAELHPDKFERCLASTNLILLKCEEEIKLDFSVTNFFFSMRLFMKNGTYDFFHNIVSFEASALRFGEDLFRHYEKRSVVVTLTEGAHSGRVWAGMT